MEKVIHTIGHSTHSSEKFINLLRASHISMLVDIRRFPASRRYPHFNRDVLAKDLQKHDIEYIHMEMLGGRRQPRPGSVNTGWRNTSFRGYADYMETAGFQQAVSALEEHGKKKSVAIMCSEAVWWSCHRSLVADYLKWKGWKVLHIMGEGKTQEHPYTSPARPTPSRLSYAADGELPLT